MTCTAVRRFRASFSYHRRKEAKHDESEIRAGTMPGVTQEQIEQARESDLFAYIQSHEPGVLKREEQTTGIRSMTAWSMLPEKITGIGIAGDAGSTPWTI